jgi:hypothetical protein
LFVVFVCFYAIRPLIGELRTSAYSIKSGKKTKSEVFWPFLNTSVGRLAVYGIAVHWDIATGSPFAQRVLGDAKVFRCCGCGQVFGQFGHEMDSLFDRKNDRMSSAEF